MVRPFTLTSGRFRAALKSLNGRKWVFAAVTLPVDGYPRGLEMLAQPPASRMAALAASVAEAPLSLS
jgi:hypothetical protein